MKRILIWIFILITPILFWFSFTEDGNNAFTMWFGDESSEGIKIQTVKKIKLSNGLTLIPAHQFIKKKPPVPYLHVEVKGRNTSNRKIAAGLLLVDDEGRRTGYDSINDKYFEEIPNSTYEVKLTPRTKPASEIAVVNIQPTKSQSYRLEVIGHQNITYGLSVSAFPMVSHTVMVNPQNVIGSGELHSYSVSLGKNSNNVLLSNVANEPLSTSFSIKNRGEEYAIDSADIKRDVTYPNFSKDKLKSHVDVLQFVDEKNAFNFVYSDEFELKEDWGETRIDMGSTSVQVKVLPLAEGYAQFRFNRAHHTLQSFAAMSLPRTVGIVADSSDSGIHPIGITGTQYFTSKNGIKGIQTYVLHETRSNQQKDETWEIDYVVQGPVYLFALKPNLKSSPVLVIAPSETVNSHRPSEQEHVFQMANSVNLLQ